MWRSLNGHYLFHDTRCCCKTGKVSGLSWSKDRWQTESMLYCCCLSCIKVIFLVFINHIWSWYLKKSFNLVKIRLKKKVLQVRFNIFSTTTFISHQLFIVRLTCCKTSLFFAFFFFWLTKDNTTGLSRLRTKIVIFIKFKLEVVDYHLPF